NDGGQLVRYDLEAAVSLTRAAGARFVVQELDLRDERRLRPTQQAGQHLPDLVRVVVHGLLAHDHDVRRFLLDQRTENPRHRIRIERASIVDANGAIDAHRQRGADLFVDGRRSDRDAHDLRRFAAFANPQRFLDGNLVERVYHRLG